MQKFTLVLIIITLVMGSLSISCSPLSAEEHFKKGITLFNEKQLDKAITEFTQAIELDPELIMAYYYRGRAYWGKGQELEKHKVILEAATSEYLRVY